MKFSMDSMLLRKTLETFDRIGERDCGIVKLKGIDRNRRQFLPCSKEHCFCFFHYSVEVCFVSSSF